LFHNIVSVSNLLRAWKEFKKGKIKKKDVGQFELNLEDNIFHLHHELVSKTYEHGSYQDFYVSDPKRRHIHKATVRDRVLHQAIFRILYDIFDKNFIYDSYSSRKQKGTHIGVEIMFGASRKASGNWKVKTYALKCDIKKFFDSIDHSILRNLIKRKVSCLDTLELVDLLFKSFEKEKGRGLPLGSVTSQLFANIYLNELDQFVKHVLKTKYYFRYCDDFVIIHRDKYFLLNLIEKLQSFLYENLALNLHPSKVEVRSFGQGVDFLGYVALPHMVVLRTRTKKRIVNKIDFLYRKCIAGSLSKVRFQSVLTSYLGIVSHCRNSRVKSYIKRFL
jgi:RNA-directed DNA polymerase